MFVGITLFFSSSVLITPTPESQMQQPPPSPGNGSGSTDHRAFVKTHGIGTEDARRKREELTVRIRKQAREESLRKRRQATEPNPTSALEVAQQLADCQQGIYSGDLQRTLRAVEGYRKLLSVEKNPPIVEVIKANVVPRLIEFLVAQDEALQVCNSLRFSALN